MTKNTIIYLVYVVLASAAVWSVWRFKRLRAEFRTLAIFVFLSAFVQGLSEIIAVYKANNLFLSHAYTVLSFLVLLRFYQHLLKPFFSKFLFAGISIGFVWLAVFNVLLWQPLSTFNSITLTVQALVFIVFSLSTFILTLNEELNQHLRSIARSLNWINSGILLYFTGSLLIFYNGATIIHAIAGRWSAYTMLIHAVLAMVLYLCLFIGLWLSPKM